MPAYSTLTALFTVTETWYPTQLAKAELMEKRPGELRDHNRNDQQM